MKHAVYSSLQEFVKGTDKSMPIKTQKTRCGGSFEATRSATKNLTESPEQDCKNNYSEKKKNVMHKNSCMTSNFDNNTFNFPIELIQGIKELEDDDT